jgi:ABC-type spermidine/putrescine transport system permease subunit I
MLDDLWDWLFAFLPPKVQTGCLIVMLLAIGIVVVVALVDGW